MKKITNSLIALLVISISWVGCLKDSGFDNHEYGINKPSGNRGISINKSTIKSTTDGNFNAIELGLTPLTVSQTLDMFELNLESEAVADKDIIVTLAYKNSLIDDYNANNNASDVLDTFVTGDVKVNLKVTIPKGSRMVTVPITVPNASLLDLAKKYAIAFTIVSVDDAATTIAQNLKDVMVTFNIKNIYDGEYRLYGGFYRSDILNYVGVSKSPRGYYESMYLLTKTANACDAAALIQGAYYNTQFIYNTQAAYVYFTGVNPRINIDAVSNDVTVTQANNSTTGALSVPFTQSTTELADSKFYPTGIPGVAKTSGQKTIVAHFKWSSTGIDRVCKDTFVYKGPR